MQKEDAFLKTEDGLDLIWGAKNIGAEIKTNERRAYHLLESGLIPARKIGASWVTSRRELRAVFSFTKP